MKNALKYILIIALTVSGSAQQLKHGDIVPEFSALNSDGIDWKSSDVTTDFLVVYFYPAAMTGGCTKQACAYRDDKASFDKMNVTVIGVSGDEVKNLQYFKEAYNLNFPLLSDSNGFISKTFGIPTTNGNEITREINGENILLTRAITTPRWTFVLDKNRAIIYKNSEVNASEDSEKVIEVIKNFTN